MSHSDAKLFRDTVEAIVQDVLDKRMPPDRYAKVVGFVEGERRVQVVYNGEPEDNVVTIPYGSVTPAGIGEWVRVGGPRGDRRVIDATGGVAQERAISEIERGAYVPPKWLAMDTRLITTFPMPLFLEDYSTMAVGPNTLYGTVVRVPWDISASQFMCYVAGVEGGGTGNLGLAIYELDGNYNMNLLDSTVAPRSGSAAEYRRDLGVGRIELRRAQQIVLTVWNNSSQNISIANALGRPERSLDAQDFLSFSMPNQTSIPSYISRASLDPARVRKDAMLHLTLLDVRE